MLNVHPGPVSLHKSLSHFSWGEGFRVIIARVFYPLIDQNWAQCLKTDLKAPGGEKF